MAIEKFTPNIKNPGINKATGAYARGDIAEQAMSEDCMSCDG